MTWLRSRRPDRDERGAIAPMAGLLMVVVLAVTAIAVDLGLGRAAARDMQAVADAVALDAARALPASCGSGTVTTAAQQSLARQGQRIGRNDTMTVRTGKLSATGQFLFTSSGTCNAVEVRIGATVDYAFAPVIGQESGPVARTAVGSRAEPALCFSVGTKTLSLNTAESALAPLLAGVLQADLSVVGYEGLVNIKNTYVPLAQIAVELGLGSPDAITNANVSLGALMLATARVLAREYPAVNLTALNAVAAQVNHVRVRLGDILTLDTTGTNPLEANIGALDLLTAGILKGALNLKGATGLHAIDASGQVTAGSGLSISEVKLTVIEAPKIACGPVGTKAESAQVRLGLKTGIPVLGLLRAADLSLGVKVGEGSATFSSVNCSTTSPTAGFNATSAGASIVGFDGTGHAKLDIVTLLGIRLLGIDIGGSVAAGSSTFTFPYPANTGNANPATKSVTGGVNLSLNVLPTTLLGLLLSPVTSVLSNVVSLIGNNVLTPVLGALGIGIGRTDVTVMGRPSCNGVKLAG
ncbi:TadG family pilus assembly protein [Aeromicrobium sp. Leaf350]|uniref:TadG family pilus assembly protein n=1 Tax=Aeromicrobium sp. Leaf350 TaxID=2876565 RepID=UPI001E518833|nr:TadG family pilus assembly protein [Aeromicrobium sp. Leaf350]